MVPYVIIEWSLIPEILRIPKVLKLAPIGDYLKLFTRIWAYLSGVGGGGYFEGGHGNQGNSQNCLFSIRISQLFEYIR